MGSTGVGGGWSRGMGGWEGAVNATDGGGE